MIVRQEFPMVNIYSPLQTIKRGKEGEGVGEVGGNAGVLAFIHRLDKKALNLYYRVVLTH